VFDVSIIDDLKRLERLGDECSDTTRKIRVATKNLAEKILELTKDYPYKLADGYKRRSYTIMENGKPVEKVFLLGPNSETVFSMIDALNGLIDNDELVVGVDNEFEYNIVFKKISAKNYEQFARDIAGGLLEEICNNVENYINNSKENIETIEKADVK
jgi:hypothetical protein